MDNFVIRAYGLQELGLFYFPNNAPSSASGQLKKWMKKKQLYDELIKAGYQDGQKILTPLQVEIIVRHIGKP